MEQDSQVDSSPTWLILFDDGIGGTHDGAERLLATAIEDDDTPGKLLYYYPQTASLEKIYFLLGFVIQMPKLLSDIMGDPGVPKLLDAQRRLALGCILHSRLGDHYQTRPSERLLEQILMTEIDHESADEVTCRKRSAADDRSRAEAQPRMYIALDSMHLAISYHQGIIGILTSDLGLKSNALADHLESVFRGFWFLEGSKDHLLRSCGYIRERYVATVERSAKQLSALIPRAEDPLRFLPRSPYMEHYIDGPSAAWSLALVLASQIAEFMARQTQAIGCCIGVASASTETPAEVSGCILSTVNAACTQLTMALVEALMFNCGNFDGPLRQPVYLSHAQAMDMERSLPPLQPRCNSFCGALELLVFWHGPVAVACLVPLGHEGRDWAKFPEWLVGSATMAQSLDSLLRHVRASKRAKSSSNSRVDQAQVGVDPKMRFKGASTAAALGSAGAREGRLGDAFPVACEIFRSSPGCSQVFLGREDSATLCRNEFSSWSALTSSLDGKGDHPFGVDLERHMARELGI